MELRNGQQYQKKWRDITDFKQDRVNNAEKGN